MNEKINQIIDELVKLDPGFESHRMELEKIIQSIVAAKPDVNVDMDFVRSLRVQLMQNKDANPNLVAVLTTAKNNFMKKVLFTVSGVVVLLLVAVVGLQKLHLNNSKPSLSFGTDVRINHTSDQAFGSLTTLSLATNQTQNGASVAPATGLGGGGGVSDNTKLGMPIYYNPVNYNFAYKGDDLNLTQDKLDVLQKQTPDPNTLISGADSINLGLVNLGSFNNHTIQSISFGGNSGSDYNIYVDFVGGNISINGGYQIMPLAAEGTAAPNSTLCTVNGCPTPDPIKESDIPDDATLIGIANQFLSDHGISTTTYGTAEVQNQFRIQNYAMKQSNPKALVYWPESIEVVYPFKVGDGEVYDESGQKMGLMVSLEIRSQKVTSVSNLTTQEYQASSYDAETDSSRILKVAEEGGLYGGYNSGDPNAKNVEIDLGTPTMQFVSMWNYSQNNSQQVLVPSLVFPITNPPTDGSFYRQSVVVPLIKQILDQNAANVGRGGPVKIMNQVTPAVAPAKPIK